jgi:hypothetical protein
VDELVRMHGQRGLFTWLDSEKYFELQGFLEDTGRGNLLTQLIISDQALIDGLRDLRAHGNDYRLLFPDLTGAAMHANAKIYANWLPFVILRPGRSRRMNKDVDFLKRFSRDSAIMGTKSWTLKGNLIVGGKCAQDWAQDIAFLEVRHTSAKTPWRSKAQQVFSLPFPGMTFGRVLVFP